MKRTNDPAEMRELIRRLDVQVDSERRIHARLLEWAAWVRRRVDNGVGWPSFCPMLRDYRAPEWPDPTARPVPVDVDDVRAEATDVALLQLWRIYPLDHEAVQWRYVGDWVGARTDQQKANACNCSETAFKQRVRSGQRFLAALLLAERRRAVANG